MAIAPPVPIDSNRSPMNNRRHGVGPNMPAAGSGVPATGSGVPDSGTVAEHNSAIAGRRVRLLCAVAVALLWFTAGRRFGWFALGWVALTPLLWAAYGLPRRARWRLAYLTGILSYTLINWWVVLTITHSSPVVGIPAVIGCLLGTTGLAIIALVHGLQVGLIGLLWSPTRPIYRRAAWLMPIEAAIVWTAFDALRCETEVAHSWGALAYTQWRDTALLQTAAYVGQHGLTALLVWFAASIALWVRTGHALHWRLPVAVFAALHVMGAWRLAQAPAEPNGLRVLLVQTNIPFHGQPVEGPPESSLAQAVRLTREATGKARFDLIVWPETVATLRTPPGFTRPNSLDLYEIAGLSNDLHTSILFGAQHAGSAAQRAGETQERAVVQNVAVLATPDGGLQMNAKRQVVPFGERAPYSERLTFLRRLAPDPPITPADHSQPLTLPDGRKIGTLICFESCFRNPAKAMAREGAQAFFVVTNDEWSHGTTSPWDHAAMSTVRAVENDVAVAQAGNTGYTFVIDRYGRFMLNQLRDSPSYPLDFISHQGRAEAIAAVLPMPEK